MPDSFGPFTYLDLELAISPRCLGPSGGKWSLETSRAAILTSPVPIHCPRVLSSKIHISDFILPQRKPWYIATRQFTLCICLLLHPKYEDFSLHRIWFINFSHICLYKAFFKKTNLLKIISLYFLLIILLLFWFV